MMNDSRVLQIRRSKIIPIKVYETTVINKNCFKNNKGLT